MGVMRVIGVMGLMEKRHRTKNNCAQPDSEISNLAIPTVLLAVGLVPQSGDPSCPLVLKTAPAQPDSKISNLGVDIESSLPQRHSKMSNGRLSGGLCWPHGRTDGCPVGYAGRMGGRTACPVGYAGRMGGKLKTLSLKETLECPIWE